MSTEGNRPEEALTSSEQELRLLVEALPALVWRAGPEGNIEYVNKRVLEYLGAPLSEVIGWGWMDKVHPDDVALKVRTWLQNLESGNPHDAVCTDDVPSEVNWSAFPQWQFSTLRLSTWLIQDKSDRCGEERVCRPRSRLFVSFRWRPE